MAEHPGSPELPDDHPRIGIPLSHARFRTLVAEYLRRLERGDAFEIEDYVTMARLWNTIQFQRLAGGDDLYARYAAAFFPSQIATIERRLHATPTKGMALYSREHDLYVGGTPHPNSQFRLEREP